MENIRIIEKLNNAIRTTVISVILFAFFSKKVLSKCPMGLKNNEIKLALTTYIAKKKLLGIVAVPSLVWVRILSLWKIDPTENRANPFPRYMRVILIKCYEVDRSNIFTPVSLINVTFHLETCSILVCFPANTFHFCPSLFSLSN